MLKDITIGQYFPKDSIVHRLDPRIKIWITVVLIAMLFLIDSLAVFVIPVAFVLVGYVASTIPLGMMLKSVKPLIPLVLFTGILNLFFVQGEPIVSVWRLTITYEGIEIAVNMAVRILCLIGGSSLLTYTTSPIALTDGIERMMAPLKKIKFPAHELAMMMTIALRFIPTLLEETDKIMSAQKARGADLETGSLVKRIKALVPILIPLFVSAFRRAEELALSMECRCYHGGQGRTRMRQLHYTYTDFLCLALSLVCLAGVIVCRSVGM